MFGNNHGSMKIVLIIIAIVFIFGLVTLLGVGGYLMGINNQCVQYENTLEAQQKQNKNSRSNMFKTIKETAQVPEMYTNDLKKVFDSVCEKRYGQEGVQAMFTWLKEHNPNFDSTMYNKLMTVIESQRATFAADQQMLIEKARVYKDYLRQMPTGWIAMHLMGFPKEDKYDPDKIIIVLDADTNKAFETGEADPINLRD